jgi:hypothetical protein
MSPGWESAELFYPENSHESIGFLETNLFGPDTVCSFLSSCIDIVRVYSTILYRDGAIYQVDGGQWPPGNLPRHILEKNKWNQSCLTSLIRVNWVKTLG